ncbi:MAG: chromate transporter, partial [Bacilli bacterium]|nr:chromate transporter [Bacilli bacterium]
MKLFLSFLRIGFTSFGGVSMIPLIFGEMEVHHWMSADDFSSLIGIAEMTPGPLGINCATFAGTKAAGFWGGIVA